MCWLKNKIDSFFDDGDEDKRYESFEMGRIYNDWRIGAIEGDMDSAIEGDRVNDGKSDATWPL